MRPEKKDRRDWRPGDIVEDARGRVKEVLQIRCEDCKKPLPGCTVAWPVEDVARWRASGRRLGFPWAAVHPLDGHLCAVCTEAREGSARQAEQQRFEEEEQRRKAKKAVADALAGLPGLSPELLRLVFGA
jgi:hypothetical protein